MTTIRRRLTVWYTVAFSLTIAVFGALLYVEQRRASARELEEQRRASLRELDNRLSLEAELARRWLSESHRVLDQITTADTNPVLAPGISAYLESFRDYTMVVGSAGHILGLSDSARRLDAGALQRLRGLFDAADGGRRSDTMSTGPGRPVLRYLVLPIRDAGPNIGGVIVAAPVKEAPAESALLPPAALLRSMLLIAPLFMAMSIAIGYWLAGTPLRPLQRITDELEAITDGRSLHRRLAPPSTADELNRLAVTLNGMLARLEQSFASLHRFTADASHELKTPLMVLRAGVERALTHPGLPSEILQALDDTLAGINGMSETVESLLTLARADEGRAPLAVEECDLREILADVAETAGILGDEAGIVVLAQYPDHPVQLTVDRRRIREMLLNLVTNAVKYTPTGGTVGLVLADEPGAVTLTVRDTGIGIAPGDLAHIFERFWRADPARARTGHRPGTGLGLAITKWIAEAHGGGITVKSRPGRGTVFTVSLPKSGPIVQVS